MAGECLTCVMAGEGRSSTSHMRCPPSSGILCGALVFLLIPSIPCPVAIAARRTVEGMSAAGLGDGAGVKSRSPRKRVREAQDLRPAPSPKHNRACHFGSDRPCEFPCLPSKVHVPALASCGIVPHQLISGRRSQRPHQEPPYAGQRARQSGPFFSCGMFQPVVDAVPCPGLRQADQARPKLAISVISCRDIPPSFDRPMP
jgi:hypothetical protein